MYFLWNYPRNTTTLARTFKVNEKYASGRALWKWIARIQALKGTKIVWEKNRALDRDDRPLPKFAISVDGVDCKINEPKHPTKPVDRKYYSHKFNHGALKYELAIDIFKPKLVWINGPFQASKHDITVFRDHGLLEKMKTDHPGRFVVADRGYQTSRPDEIGIMSTPNDMDPKLLKNFKTLVFARGMRASTDESSSSNASVRRSAIPRRNTKSLSKRFASLSSIRWTMEHQSLTLRRIGSLTTA